MTDFIVRYGLLIVFFVFFYFSWRVRRVNPEPTVAAKEENGL